jgi:hypothetical protein
MQLALCHPSETCNFWVAPRFLKNLCTPDAHELHDEFCKTNVCCFWVFTFLINENHVMSKKIFSCDSETYK